MKRNPRTVLSTLLAALALAAAAVSLPRLPQSDAEPSTKAPVQVAQSTSAILEDRAV